MSTRKRARPMDDQIIQRKFDGYLKATDHIVDMDHNKYELLRHAFFFGAQIALDQDPEDSAAMFHELRQFGMRVGIDRDKLLNEKAS